jgi:UDP-2,3-diacylglucosamine pyrophosphatase LpxH
MTKSIDIADFVLSELNCGTKVDEIYTLLKEKGYTTKYESFRKYILRLKKKYGIIEKTFELSEDGKQLIDIIDINKINKVENVLDQMGRNKKDFEKIINNCRKNGYEVNVDNGNIFLSKTNVREPEKVPQLSNCNEVVFGIVSDPHFGSKSCQITALNKFSEIMKSKGVKHIFTPGDLTAGFNVYPGQIHDVYAIDAKEQEESVLLNLPLGFEWYVLGGNHDYSFIKRGGGYNIISVLASKRKDIHYIGFDEATVPILKNVDAVLAHPSGGVPYSYSYRLQKSIEQITMSELQKVVRGVKEKPTIRFVLLGHLHIQVQSMFGAIWGAQCGSFEGQTNYLKRKGLVPSVGGYIIKATLGQNGLLKNFDSKYYMFDEIEDDWKNYKHSIPESKIEKPIFEK